MSSDAMGTAIADAVLALTPAEKADTEFAWQTISAEIFKFLDSTPIGVIKPWDKSMPNTPALDDTWAECNGQFISDSGSPYNGYRIRNLNGADVIFSVSWSAGIATISTANIAALSVGDSVTGTGITSGSIITDITGNIVTMSDTGFSGTINTTFTNKGNFIRGGITSGNSKNDAMQRITGSFRTNRDVSNTDLVNSPLGAFYNTTDSTRDRSVETNAADRVWRRTHFDSSLSTSPNQAKTDDEETYPKHTEMVMIMKIK